MRKIISSFFEYLFVLCVLLEYFTAYTESPFADVTRVIRYIPFLILPVLIFYKGKVFKSDFGLVIILLIGSILPMFNVVNGALRSYIERFVCFFPLTVLYIISIFRKDNNSVKNLLYRLSNVIVLEAFVSIVFWLFGSILGIVDYTFLFPIIYGDERFVPSYYGLYFETQKVLTSSFTDILVRNGGIFVEGPFHNLVLCTSLAVELFLRPHITKIRVVIIVTAILSVFSTTGYIVMLIMCFLRFMQQVSHNSRTSYFMFPLFLIILAFSIITVLDNKKETGSTSYDNRGYDIVRCIEVGLENPVLGVGIFHAGNEMGAGKNRFGYSNSLFGVFAHGGFYFLFLYVASLLFSPFFYYKKTKDKCITFLFLCYFILFTFTFSQYKYLTFLFMAIGIAYWKVPVVRHNHL